MVVVSFVLVVVARPSLERILADRIANGVRIGRQCRQRVVH
jgi:hypothetical protein